MSKRNAKYRPGRANPAGRGQRVAVRTGTLGDRSGHRTPICARSRGKKNGKRDSRGSPPEESPRNPRAVGNCHVELSLYCGQDVVLDGVLSHGQHGEVLFAAAIIATFFGPLPRIRTPPVAGLLPILSMLAFHPFQLDWGPLRHGGWLAVLWIGAVQAAIAVAIHMARCKRAEPQANTALR